MRVLVTGSRTWADAHAVYQALGECLVSIDLGSTLTVVHGDASRGADRMARGWARSIGSIGDRTVVEEPHPAQWDEHGKRAGMLRNIEMVNLGADLVLAFIQDDSPGASHTVREARKAGLVVNEFRVNTEVAVTEETGTVESPSLVQRLIAVKRDIGAVGKGDRNQAQGFNFRGIDAVLNAVAGPLMKHGVMVYPTVLSAEKGTASTSRGGTMNTYLVKVDYTFTDGEDEIVTRVIGEAFDSGDKGATKAMSVAYRTALIQALSLPTDEPDPDHDVYDAQPKIEQMNDAALIEEATKATDVSDLQNLWRQQNVNARPAQVQEAIKSIVAKMQGETSA